MTIDLALRIHKPAIDKYHNTNAIYSTFSILSIFNLNIFTFCCFRNCNFLMQVKLSVLCTCVIHILYIKPAQLLKLNTLYHIYTYVRVLHVRIHLSLHFLLPKKFSCCCYYFVDNQIIILYCMKMEAPNI